MRTDASRLHLVPQQPEPEKHIGDLNRADAMKRDWSRCHIAADKREPVRINIAKPWRWA